MIKYVLWSSYLKCFIWADLIALFSAMGLWHLVADMVYRLNAGLSTSIWHT
jgi:hypothetical protein